MYRLRFAVPVLVAGLLTSGLLLGQDKKTDSKEPVFISKTLPRYYRQLGLSDKQKENIYKVRASYAVKIKELQNQIKELQGKEKGELEKVLTAAQKARLRELLSGGAAKEDDIKDKPTETKKK
jgi:hypothetical protein